MNIETLLNQIEHADASFIYGAGIVATSVYTVLNKVCGRRISAFLVSNEKENPLEIDGIPVIALDKNERKTRSSALILCAAKATDGSKYDNMKKLVLAAVPQVYFKEIDKQLKKHGYEHIIYIDTKTENELLASYFSKCGDFLLLKQNGSDLDRNKDTKGKGMLQSLRVYMAKSHLDKPLSGHYTMPDWMIPVQAGTALTDLSIAALQDNTGDNISYKNADYCELTVTYWAWKNAAEDYIGLCHYRRVFDLNEADIQNMMDENIDAVLLFPSIHYPSAMNQHIRYLEDQEWEVLWEAIRNISKENTAELEKILEQPYFYNYNMLIARKEIYAQYCQWMFAVLEETERIFKKRDIIPRKRYAGYMGETLTTLFFMSCKETCNIVHTGKDWLF